MVRENETTHVPPLYETEPSSWTFDVGDFVDVRYQLEGTNVYSKWELAEVIDFADGESKQCMHVRTEMHGEELWLDVVCDRENVSVAFTKQESSSAISAKTTPFDVAMSSVGMKVHDVKADGNCLFRAISYRVSLTEDHHIQLRRMICEHMLKYRNHFGLYCEGSFDIWLEKMRHVGTWGDALCIQAAEEVLDRPIKVYSTESSVLTEPMNLVHNNIALSYHLSSVVPIELSYHGQSHYNALVPRVGKPRPLPIRDSNFMLNGRLKGWRTPKKPKNKKTFRTPVVRMSRW